MGHSKSPLMFGHEAKAVGYSSRHLSEANVTQVPATYSLHSVVEKDLLTGKQIVVGYEKIKDDIYQNSSNLDILHYLQQRGCPRF